MKKAQYQNSGTSSNGGTIVHSQNFNNSHHYSNNASTNTQQSHVFYSNSNNAKNRHVYSNSYSDNHHQVERKNSYPSSNTNNTSSFNQKLKFNGYASSSSSSSSTSSSKRNSLGTDNVLSEQVKNMNLNEAQVESKNELPGEKKLVRKSESNSEQLNPSDTSTENSRCLSDLVKPENEYKDKSGYYRSLIMAVDDLYPDTKWPLHSTWTFWLIKFDSNKNWLDNLKVLMDVAYVEDFWSAMNYLQNVPNLTSLGDLTFFKKGIKPMWEDEENKSGGCWLHQVGLQQQNKKIDELWQETLLAMIGDNFCGREAITSIDPNVNNFNENHVCDFISGAVLMHRIKTDKIALWTKNYKDDHTTRLIGKVWKNLLKLSEIVTINFEAHDAKNNKNGTIEKNRIIYKE